MDTRKAQELEGLGADGQERLPSTPSHETSRQPYLRTAQNLGTTKRKSKVYNQQIRTLMNNRWDLYIDG
jgi:hypothetical protein